MDRRFRQRGFHFRHRSPSCEEPIPIARIQRIVPVPETAPLEIVRFPVLETNYTFILHHAQSGQTVVVDPAERTPVLALCQQRGWSLTHIWNTHHHGDHTGGNLALKDATGAQVIGSAQDIKRIPGLDIAVAHGAEFLFADIPVQVIDVSGHTLGHIAFYLPSLPALFCGDAVFSLGCGRMFEGTAPQYWESLRRIKALPDATQIYCAHEYTEANLAFASHIDPENAALAARGVQITALRAQGHPTIPFLLGDEKATNPFLRADDPIFAATLGYAERTPAELFAYLRRAKDHF
jgi:hydroxyacylglutathione hydrolase